VIILTTSSDKHNEEQMTEQNADIGVVSNSRLGIHDIDNDAYHSGPGISKSGLWKLYTKSPAHFIGAERKETAAMTFGSACHMAVLEPHLLETSYCVVPTTAPRRPTEAQWNAKAPSPESVAAMNWWREFMAFNAGKETINQADFDNVLRIRDKLHAHPLIQKLVNGAQFEQSAYWIDEETGELCRCRPDIYSPSLKMIGDIKTCRDASEFGFARAIEDYGYHVQDPFYSDGWHLAGGGEVDAFVFIAIESEAPFVFQVYELDEADKQQGREIYRKALRRYADCKRTGIWPDYGNGVKTITRPAWAHKKESDFSDAA
jgi:hypothetical protein